MRWDLGAHIVSPAHSRRVSFSAPNVVWHRKPPALAPPLLGKPHCGFPAALTHDLRVMRGIEKLRVIFGGHIRRFGAVSDGLGLF